MVNEKNALRLADEAYIILHSKCDIQHELTIMDSRFLDPNFNKERASLILDGLEFEDLEQLHKWLGALIQNCQPALPGL